MHWWSDPGRNRLLQLKNNAKQSQNKSKTMFCFRRCFMWSKTLLQFQNVLGLFWSCLRSSNLLLYSIADERKAMISAGMAFAMFGHQHIVCAKFGTPLKHWSLPHRAAFSFFSVNEFAVTATTAATIAISHSTSSSSSCSAAIFLRDDVTYDVLLTRQQCCWAKLILWLADNSSDFSDLLLPKFASNFEIVSQN